MSLEVSIFIAISMLIGNALFVGAEFGLISARRSSIELRAMNGSKAARITLNAMENVTLMLAGAQLGVTLCSLILGAVSEPMIAHLLQHPLETFNAPAALIHAISFSIALSLTVYLHVVIGEMLPKNIALAHPEKTALFLTPPLMVFIRVTRPIVLGLNQFANWCLSIFHVKSKNEVASTFTHDEVAGFIEESSKEGLLKSDEISLLSGALRFDERTVKAVLLPLETVTSAPTSATPNDIENLAAQTGFSRFIILGTNQEIRGYIHLKDMLYVDEDELHIPIPASDLRPLANIQITDTLRSALTIMQQSGRHIAQVTGQGNKIVGIVMLEDVLEELVGEISDGGHKKP
ncbi:MAG: hemolysin family protein [Candidatus Saccharimonadales bacterium]